LARWAEEKLYPKVDWRKQLAAAIRYAAADTVGATDYSYRRPSRRQGQVGKGDVIFPSMRCPLPSVAVVADTSASISESMLAQTLAEISGILKSIGQKEGVHVLAVWTRPFSFAVRYFVRNRSGSPGEAEQTCGLFGSCCKLRLCRNWEL
jgi:predicted metal-dependent peptidase